MAKKINYKEFIDENQISFDASSRGGSIKIDVLELFPDLEGEAIMGAYQNYLGGELAGSVVGASMFNPDDLSKDNRIIFDELKEEIKKYFFYYTNEIAEDWDEWSAMSYKKNQNMPVSAY